MNILVYADPHFCSYSSIIRKQGEKYSLRLENLIQSINWVHDLAKNKKCDMIVCLGDFFDSNTLDAQELSALSRINFEIGIPMYFLVGNHELSTKESRFNSANAFRLNNHINIINTPLIRTAGEDVNLCFLPYCFENEIKLSNISIFDFIPTSTYKSILFSHNDILGYNYGQFVSKTGIDVNEIEKYFHLCFNGHLHNEGKVSDKIINVGNLTGLNFSEDATKYDHSAYILNTILMTYEKFENPFAFNFYKLDFTTNIPNVDFKQNSIVSAKVNESDYTIIKNMFESNSNIIEYRIIIQKSSNENHKTIDIDFSINHLDEFRNYVLKNIGDTDYILQELAEVCK